MRNFYVVVFLLFSQLLTGQELLNAYLEPTGNPNLLNLKTVVWHFNTAGIMESNLVVNGNQLEFRLCYGSGAGTSETYEELDFDIPLPPGYSNYEFQLNFFHIDNEGNCDYSQAFDSLDLSFNFPYNPTATISIPDANFEGYLEHYGFGDDIGANGLVYAHRFVNIARLTISDVNLTSLGLGLIADLDGVQQLYRLKYLLASENEFPVFDATNHPQLLRLDLYGNPITDLNVTNCPDMEMLIAGTILGNLDLSNNPDLIYLGLSSPNITAIDISNNIHLNTLFLHEMQLNELDLSNNLEVNSIGIKGTTLNTLSIPSLNGLFDLSILGNLNLTALTIGNYPILSQITIKNNTSLTSVDLSGAPNLVNIDLVGNALETLDLSNQPVLEIMIVMENNLQSIDLRNGSNVFPYTILGSNNPDMFCVAVNYPQDAPYGQWIFDGEVIYSDQCEDPIIDFPDPLFEWVLVNENVLDLDGDGVGDVPVDTNEDGFIQYFEVQDVEHLVVSGFGINSIEGIVYFNNLSTLDASNNNLHSVDFSDNSNMTSIRLSNNVISDLILGVNDNLQELWIDNNVMDSFNNQYYPNITSLRVNSNNLTFLRINNGNNTILTEMHAQNNQSLYCIRVDDVEYANSQPNWLKDKWAEFNEACILGIEELALKDKIRVYPNPVQELLKIESDVAIQSIDLYDVAGRIIKKSDSTMELYLSELQAGVYFIHIQTSEGELVQQIVKK